MAAKRVVITVEINAHLVVQMIVCSAVTRVDYLAAKRASAKVVKRVVC